jgi:hypothetical protein
MQAPLTPNGLLHETSLGKGGCTRSMLDASGEAVDAYSDELRGW